MDHKMVKNNLKKIRESLMMSKAELARKASISPITITRIEQGMPCRMETKRKILLALGLKISDKRKVFGEDTELSIKKKKERHLVYDRRQISYDMFIPERRSGKDRRQESRTRQ
jgi:DNA-binding XRE family transcriptional regulator